jgi:CubicO group peptidase (beta-lactamase class C family)
MSLTDAFPKILARLVAILLLACPLAITQGPPANSIDFNKLADDYFAPLLASKRLRAAAVIVTNKESTIFAKTYGPVDFDRTVWRGASVSKALTAIAVMRLVEQGKLDLDTDVNHYLKTFQVPSTYQQPITLRLLLEHRSGLDDPFIGDGFRNGSQPPMRLLMQKSLPARVYAPGEVEFYSNYGYALIGAVIEDITGQRFEEYVDANVLHPLAMKESTFAQPLSPDRAALTAPGVWWYQRSAPAGGLATTAADMATFLRATMQQDSAVLTKQSFEQMTRPLTAKSGFVHRLGYWTGREHGQQLIAATGDSGSFHNVLVTWPGLDIGLVVLVSGSGSGATGFYRKFSDALLGKSDALATTLNPKPGDRERCARFAGLYRTVRYPHHDLAKTFIILSSTRVTLEPDGALRFNGARWVQTGPLQYEKEDGSAAVSFKEDNRGRIRFMGDTDERIEWYQSGAVNIGFYFLFTLFCGFACWRAKGLLRWISAVALLHSAGWLTLVLITGPENLIFGLPFALKGILWIGTATPTLAAVSLYAVWRSRTALSITAAILLACYIPFVFYWNLRM